MDNVNDNNEKKPKRPRISIPRTDNADGGDNTQNNYQAGGYTGSDNYNRAPRPYQPRQYQPRPYQQRPYNNRYNQGGDEGGDGQQQQHRPYNNHYNQGGYQPRPYQPRYNNRPMDGDNAGEQGDGQGENQNMQRPYQPRYNNYNNNGPRQQGGYRQNNNRQGGYNNGPRQQGGYRQNNNNRQGGYNNGPRQGGYNNGPRQGGYNNGPRQQGGYNKQRGNMNQRHNQAFPGKGKSFTPRPKPVEYELPAPNPDEQIRLNKFMANSGICSRREADEFIQQGLVKVNGNVVTELGTKITHSDVVEYDDKVVALERKCYILLNKPKDCVTTSDDPNGRTTVMDLVKGACNERIYPVGRLDRNTTGVLLLTNDGDLASKLTHPQYVKKKIYHVWTDKDITEDDMQRIADGIELEDGEIHADAISYATETDRNQAGIEIHSGRNRIVRRIFESLGYHVTKLDRVYFAGLTKKNLPRGRWRYLTQQEVNFLKMGSFE